MRIRDICEDFGHVADLANSLGHVADQASHRMRMDLFRDTSYLENTGRGLGLARDIVILEGLGFQIS